jgi:hypothetical protein
MPSGRKSLKDEIAVLSRYNELSVPYFKFIREMLNSDAIENQKWAAERLDKAFVKMVPQTIQGDNEGGPIQIKIVNYGDSATLPVPAKAVPTSSS